MNHSSRLTLVAALVLISALSVIPWSSYGIQIPSLLQSPAYRLGLDLHGGVELDYKVDFSEMATQSGSSPASETQVIEGLKSIIDKRVRSITPTEPTIMTARYGQDSHIIVQIPTQDHGDLSPAEQQARNEEEIKQAKETIGKVVKLEFKEEKKTITEVDRVERKAIAEKALTEIQTGGDWQVIGTKYQTQYENVGYATSTGGALPYEARFDGYEAITTFPYTTGVVLTKGQDTIGMGADGQTIETLTGSTGYAIVRLDRKIASVSASGASLSGSTTEPEYAYSLLFVDERPSLWTPAQTADGRVLNDKYLLSAGVSFTQVGSPQVDLVFNDEGKKIFAELTTRLVGKQIAIYVGGEMLTAPTVQTTIGDGRAIITGDYTIASAQKLANDINTGIVPAPIYLTSERTIDAKIGATALTQVLQAGALGLLAIIIFLTVFYRVSGLLAGVALVIYALILVALVKYAGVVLSLASIAGVILSIGLAIDANILIFERIREALRSGTPLEKAIVVGFDKSWTAIWDSHITSLTSAVILYIFGISMIKGFGLMLGLGIVLSLFTAMWVSRALIMAVGSRPCMRKNLTWFIGK